MAGVHEDFGEKIGGAKKDLWKDRGLYADDLEAMNEREAEKFVKKDNVWKKPDYAAMLEEGMTPEQILEHILGDMELEILDTIPTKFYCNCSKDRVSKAVISVGKEEIQKMIDDGEPIEVNCHFCNSHYTFTVDELKEMYDCCTR